MRSGGDSVCAEEYMYSLLVSHYIAIKPATSLKFYYVIAERKLAEKHI